MPTCLLCLRKTNPWFQSCRFSWLTVEWLDNLGLIFCCWEGLGFEGDWQLGRRQCWLSWVLQAEGYHVGVTNLRLSFFWVRRTNLWRTNLWKQTPINSVNVDFAIKIFWVRKTNLWRTNLGNQTPTSSVNIDFARNSERVNITRRTLKTLSRFPS